MTEYLLLGDYIDRYPASQFIVDPARGWTLGHSRAHYDGAATEAFHSKSALSGAIRAVAARYNATLNAGEEA